MTFEASILDAPQATLSDADHNSWVEEWMGGQDPAVIAALTSAFGTANGAMADPTATWNATAQGIANDNWQEAVTKIEQIRAALVAIAGVGDKLWTPTVANSGAIVRNSLSASSTNWAGSIRLSTGTVAAGSAQLRLGYGATNGDSMSALSTNDRIAMEFHLRLPALSTAGQEAVWKFGLLNNAGNGGIWFEYDRATSVNWRVKTADGTTTNAQTTSLAVAATTNLKLRFEGIHNHIEFFVDDVEIGDSVANIPAAGTVVYSPYMNITKTAGSGTARIMESDWVRFRQVFATRR